MRDKYKEIKYAFGELDGKRAFRQIVASAIYNRHARAFASSKKRFQSIACSGRGEKKSLNYI